MREILELRPYLDTLSPLVDLSNVGKVGQHDHPPVPTYQAGTLEPITSDGITTFTERVDIVGHHNPTGRGYICIVHRAGNRSNLKRGERKALKRSNLTAYARRMIVSAGDAMEKMVHDGMIKYATLVTLSYRKNVPDHKTAKIHLANWLRLMKKYGYCKYYVWAAQNQNGERATKLGLDSYRKKNGDGIHFHIITTRIPIEKAREAWRNIVHTWERENGYQVEKISGVDIQKVNNASRYISRYITTEDKAGTILGNMWGMSAPLRKLSKYTKTNAVTITVAEWKQYIKTYKIGHQEYSVKQKNGKWMEPVFTVKDWKRLPIVFFKNIPAAITDVYRFKRHLRQLEKILLNAKITTIQGRTMDVETHTLPG